MRLRTLAAVVLTPPALASCSAPLPVEQAVVTSTRERIVVRGTGDVSLDPCYLPALRAPGVAAMIAGIGTSRSYVDARSRFRRSNRPRTGGAIASSTPSLPPPP